MFIPPGIRPGWKQGFARSAGESAYPNLWKGLVGAWIPAFGPTGNTLFDISSNKNHGTLVGMDPATDWVVGEKGYTLDFNGSTDSIDVSTFNDSGTTHTILFSINKLGQDYIFDCGPSPRFIISMGDGATSNNLSFFDGSSWKSLGLVLNNVWVHLVIVLDGASSGATGYINGKLSGTNTYNPIAITAATKIICSRFSQTGFFLDGQLSYFYIYNRILLATEIKDTYNNPLAMFQLRQPVWKAPAVVGANAPTGVLSGPLVGPFGGVI